MITRMIGRAFQSRLTAAVGISLLFGLLFYFLEWDNFFKNDPDLLNQSAVGPIVDINGPEKPRKFQTSVVPTSKTSSNNLRSSSNSSRPVLKSVTLSKQPISVPKVTENIDHVHRKYYFWNSTTKSFAYNLVSLSPNASAISPTFMQDYHLKEPFKDHSQGQLTPILQLLNFPKSGYFIELATNDYKILSNSYDLEYNFNWTGLCIEPNPEYHQNILEHRKCTLITNPVFDKADVLIEFNFNEGLGGIVAPGMDNERPKKGKVVKLPTVTFQQILTTFLPHSLPHSLPKVIDYLSLDVEGGEYEVMMGLNLNEFRFRVISIERPIDALHLLLARHGYWWLGQIKPYYTDYFGEMLYIHETTANFTAMMNDWRRHPHTKYNNEYKPFDSKFCLRPSWPFPKDHGQYLEWKKSYNYTMKMNNYYLLEEEDLFACGNARSVFLWRGGKSHTFDGIESFKLLNRDFSEVKRFSVKFCELLPRGHTMTIEAIKKTPLPSDTYWSEETAAA